MNSALAVVLQSVMPMLQTWTQTQPWRSHLLLLGMPTNEATTGTSNKKQIQGSRQQTNGQPQRRPYTFDPNIVFSEYTDCPSNSARKGQRLFKHDGVVTKTNKTAALNLYFNREHKLPFDVVLNHPRPEGSGFAYCQLGIPRHSGGKVSQYSCRTTKT